MTWNLDISIGKRIRLAVAAMEKMNCTTKVFSERMEPSEFRSFLGETLLVKREDMQDPPTILKKITETISLPCAMPEGLIKENDLEVKTESTSLELARYMGIEPIRLMLASFNANSIALHHAKKQSIVLKMERARYRMSDRFHDLLDIKIKLSPDVVWRKNMLSVKKTVMPESVLMSLEGKKLSSIMEHDWPGWNDINIMSAKRVQNSLLITTDAEELVTIS